MSTLKTSNIANLSGTSTSVENVLNGTAKAWVNFNGTGTVAIRASYNVSSITDNGVGDYSVNFTSAMIDANYSAIVTCGDGSLILGASPLAYSISSIMVATSNAGSGYITASTKKDVQYINVTANR